MTAGPTLDARLIKQSFALVEGRANEVAGHFYALLFLTDPSLRDLFPPMMDRQRDRLAGALAAAVRRADEPEGLTEYLRQLGRDHRRFGVRAEHYPTLCRCLLDAMRRFAGPAWTPAIDEAWQTAFGVAAGTMIYAAQQAALTTPPFWTGRVVGHRRPAESVALLSVEPDQPYPFRPGQAAAVETLRWPRVWRPYSIANAPRPDGLLTFQVRAVDAGWVSSALVNYTRPGDTIRIGPPVGGMVCDPISPRDVLLIGGGTGIAPIQAIVEDMTRWNTNRRVAVYYGARTEAELYALEALEAMRAGCPWLTVVPCVSHDSQYTGERGTLAEVVARHGADRSWADHEVCVSGSAPMVRATLARLAQLGIPADRVRFDAFGDRAQVQLDVLRQQRAAAPQRRVLSSGERLPQRQASKSGAASSDVGSDRQVTTKPPLYSLGSRR